MPYRFGRDTFQLQPDGWARRRFAVAGEPAARVSEYDGVDVGSHWEPMITFGDWDRYGVARPDHS